MRLPLTGWKNKRGTGKRDDPSMKSLWLRKGYPWPAECCVSGCHKPATDGAHMINQSSGSMEEWIVPTCHEHNEQEGVELTLKAGITIHKLKDLKE